MGNYLSDEELGSIGEQFVMNYYRNVECFPNIWKKPGFNPYYDLVIPESDIYAKYGIYREITAEVKTDKASSRYGNFAIESHRGSPDGKTTTLTGMNVCTANLWAHIIFGPYWGLYLMPTEELRKYTFDTVNNFPIKKGGDDARTYNVCIPIVKLISQPFCRKAIINEQDFNEHFYTKKVAAALSS